MSTKFSHALRLITFDATGTLIKFKIPPNEQYARVANLYGVHVSADQILSGFKLSWKEMSTEHPIFGKVTGLGWEKWWHELVCRTFRRSSNDTVEPAKLDSIAQDLIKGYSSGTYYELYPHVKELLLSLQDRNICLGVISNNDDRLPCVIDHFGLLQDFEFVLTSYNTGFEKPHSEIFEAALQFNNSPPECALHVGNSPKLDFLAAKKYGWNAVLVHPEDKQKLTEQYPFIPTHLIFNNLLDLCHFLT